MKSLHRIFGKACILGRKTGSCMPKENRTNQLCDLEEPRSLRRKKKGRDSEFSVESALPRQSLITHQVDKFNRQLGDQIQNLGERNGPEIQILESSPTLATAWASMTFLINRMWQKRCHVTSEVSYKVIWVLTVFFFFSRGCLPWECSHHVEAQITWGGHEQCCG